MKARLMLAVLVLLCSFPLLAQVQKRVVRMDGVEPVKIGMTLKELNAALHEHFALSNDPEERECDYFGSPLLPHISLMVVRGRLARVEVDAEGVPSEAGLQVGDSEANA